MENEKYQKNFRFIIHSWFTHSKCLQISSPPIHKGLMIWNSKIWKTGSHDSSGSTVTRPQLMTEKLQFKSWQGQQIQIGFGGQPSLLFSGYGGEGGLFPPRSKVTIHIHCVPSMEMYVHSPSHLWEASLNSLHWEWGQFRLFIISTQNALCHAAHNYISRYLQIHAPLAPRDCTI